MFELAPAERPNLAEIYPNSVRLFYRNIEARHENYRTLILSVRVVANFLINRTSLIDAPKNVDRISLATMAKCI